MNTVYKIKGVRKNMLLKRILTNAMELHVPVKLSTFDCLNNHNSTIEIDAEDCRAILPLCGQELKNQFFYAYVLGKTPDNVFLLSLGGQNFQTQQAKMPFVPKSERFINNNKAAENLIVGNIYEATVETTCFWGAFCKIGDSASVLVHVTNWSSCRFYNLSQVVKPGMKTLVKILSIRREGENILVDASRKDAYSPIDYHVGDKVFVTVSESTKNFDGVFCEICPSLNGILDIPFNTISSYKEGMKVQAKVKAITKKGLKLSLL